MPGKTHLKCTCLEKIAGLFLANVHKCPLLMEICKKRDKMKGEGNKL